MKRTFLWSWTSFFNCRWGEWNFRLGECDDMIFKNLLFKIRIRIFSSLVHRKRLKKSRELASEDCVTHKRDPSSSRTFEFILNFKTDELFPPFEELKADSEYIIFSVSIWASETANLKFQNVLWNIFSVSCSFNDIWQWE